MNVDLVINVAVTVEHGRTYNRRGRDTWPDPRSLCVEVHSDLGFDAHTNFYVEEEDIADYVERAPVIAAQLIKELVVQLPLGVRQYIVEEVRLHLEARARGAIRVAV